MSFWIAAAAISLAVVALLLWAGLRHRAESGRAEHELEVLRAQLAELQRDRDRGLVEESEAEAARREFARQALRLEKELGQVRGEKRSAPTWGLAFLVLSVPLAGLALYLMTGAPDLPGRPYAEREAERLAAAAEREAQRPVLELTARLERETETNPEDAEAWYGLGQARVQLRRYDAAVEALRRAISLAPETARYHSAFAEALILASGGEVAPGAARALEEALRLNPQDQRARFFKAIALSREGKREEALEDLIALLREAQPDSPWRPGVLQAARELAAELGKELPEDLVATAPSGPAPSLEGLSEDQRQAVRGMVEGLAARLEASPDDAEGWQRLGRSYQVLGDLQKSAEAYSRAAELLAGDAEAQRQAGLAWVRTGNPGAPLPAKAVDYFERALALDPQSIDALFFLGESARQRGDAEAARRYWRDLLPLLPQDSEIRAFVATQLDALGS